MASLRGFLGDLKPEIYRRKRFPERVQTFDVYSTLPLSEHTPPVPPELPPCEGAGRLR